MDSEETETIEDKPTEAITTPAEEQPIAPPVVADQPEPEVISTEIIRYLITCFFVLSRTFGRYLLTQYCKLPGDG